MSSADRLRELLERENVADRVHFHAVDAATIEGAADLAMAFECIHDMSDPVSVLTAARRALADDGAMLIVDERTRDAFDGTPDTWFTATGVRGPEFVSNDYQQPSSNQSAAFWYHDHAFGVTRLDVGMGLSGYSILRDPANALLQELLVNSCQEEMRALTAVRDSGSQET